MITDTVIQLHVSAVTAIFSTALTLTLHFHSHLSVRKVTARSQCVTFLKRLDSNSIPSAQFPYCHVPTMCYKTGQPTQRQSSKSNSTHNYTVQRSGTGPVSSDRPTILRIECVAISNDRTTQYNIYSLLQCRRLVLCWWPPINP